MRVLRQLGQLRPANTTAASLFTPEEAKQYKIYLIIITNVGAGAAKASIFHDVDGTTYDQTTALMYEKSISPGSSPIELEYRHGISGYEAAGNLGVQTDTANALNFTCYGEIIGEEV